MFLYMMGDSTKEGSVLQELILVCHQTSKKIFKLLCRKMETKLKFYVNFGLYSYKHCSC